MPSRASVWTSTASACSRNSSTSLAVTVSVASSFSSRPSPSVASISSPGTQATSNHDTRRVNMPKVSVRSRNQYSVVGDSGKVVRPRQAEAGGARGRPGPALVRGNPSRLGATGAADESRTGAGVSERVLRAGFHIAARVDGGHHPLGAEHRQTGEPDDAGRVREISDGTGLREGGSHRIGKPH